MVTERRRRSGGSGSGVVIDLHAAHLEPDCRYRPDGGPVQSRPSPLPGGGRRRAAPAQRRRSWRETGDLVGRLLVRADGEQEHPPDAVSLGHADHQAVARDERRAGEQHRQVNRARPPVPLTHPCLTRLAVALLSTALTATRGPIRDFIRSLLSKQKGPRAQILVAPTSKKYLTDRQPYRRDSRCQAAANRFTKESRLSRPRVTTDPYRRSARRTHGLQIAVTT